MRTLIIYDNAGRIWYQASGNVQEPVGLQHKWFNLEPGKFAIRIDVSDINNPVPVYDDSENEEISSKVTGESTEGEEVTN